MTSRLTLSNRPENLKVLQAFVRSWASERGLSEGRRNILEKITAEIFERLVKRAYRPGQPGSIAIVLEDKGPRIRLMFEDDAPAYDPWERNTQESVWYPSFPGQANVKNDRSPPTDSLIFYRTADHKNRLVVFLTL